MDRDDRRMRRQNRVRPCAEALEGRELMTGGTGDTFAIIPVTIDKPGGTATVTFTIDPTHFTLPQHKFALGIDIAPADGSTIKPLISKVISPHGTGVPQAFHSIYNPHLSHAAVAAGAGTGAVLTPIVLFPGNPTKPAQYQVTVTAESNTQGKALVGFYLPGDANGDGQVDAADIQAVKASLGTTSQSANYNFDADANRDGRIGLIDLAYTKQNLGVKVDVSPVVSAHIDQTTAPNRVTLATTAHFTGNASPGATITIAQQGLATPSATAVADALGNYSIVVPLVPGVNNLVLTSTDSFGQKITGPLSPVTRVVPTLAAPMVIQGGTMIPSTTPGGPTAL
jgi:hypothetical protein